MGLAGILSPSTFRVNSFLFFLSSKNTKRRRWRAPPPFRRSVELTPAGSEATLASLQASFPAFPSPLSGSRAAAHVVPCQIPAAPGDTCRETNAPQAPRNHGNGGQWESCSACGGGAKRCQS